MSGMKGETGREKQGTKEKTSHEQNYLITTGKKRGTLETSPSSSLSLFAVLHVVAYFSEESAVLSYMEYKGSIAISTELSFRMKHKKEVNFLLPI